MRLLLALILVPWTAFGAGTVRVAPVNARLMPIVTAVPQSGAAAGLLFPAGSLSPLSAPAQLLTSAISPLTAPKQSLGIIAPEEPRAIITPEPKKIIVPEPKKIITPEPKKIVSSDSEKTIIRPDRELTEEEKSVEKLPSTEELDRLAKSLSSLDDDSAANAAAGAETRRRSLNAAFDGTLPISAEDSAVVADYFHRDRPHAPELDQVRSAALHMFRGLLPAFYRRVPVTSRYDLAPNGSTGHLWSLETGHIIEIAPARANLRGDVSSSFGIPGLVWVQQRVEQLLQFAHEYAHVIFDAEVKKAENHPPISAYSAMTEGFAVTLEQALIDRAVDEPAQLGLGPRDVADFLAVSRGRRDWLAAVDSHYSEGIIAWRKAFTDAGLAGVAKLLTSLSAHRMIKILRTDPAYQLAVEEPELVAAYLGNDLGAPFRAGLDAVKKAVAGEELDPAEAKAAVEAIEKSGPGGWRRVFERSLLEDKKVVDARDPSSHSLPSDITAAFALARLSATVARELAVFLTETLRSGRGDNLFGRRGPNEKLNAIVSKAETLPFTEADKASWTEALTRWLFAGFPRT